MAGRRPGHPRLSCCNLVKTWMPGTSPGMTSFTTAVSKDGAPDGRGFDLILLALPKAYYPFAFSPGTHDPDAAGGDDHADKTWIRRDCILCAVWPSRICCDRCIGARYAAAGADRLHPKDPVADGRTGARLRDAGR